MDQAHLDPMRALFALMLFALPAPALAQSWTAYDGRDPAVTTADRHRWEMERLRARSDANEALARQQRLETRLTLMELQAARQAPMAPPSDWRPLASPEVERARREGAERRSRAVREGVSEIDAWLDRPQ